VTKQAHANFYTPRVVCDEIQQHQVMDSLGYNSICTQNTYCLFVDSLHISGPLHVEDQRKSSILFKLFVL
jgi:hypothetical protein